MPGLKVFTGSLWRAVGVEDSYWDILTATALPTSVSLSWPTAGNSPSSYELSIDGVITNVGNVTSYEKTGLTIGQQYQFKVRPVYSDGSTGGWSFFKNRTPLGWNAATGGSINDFISTGQSGTVTGATYRVHSFTSPGNFVVTNSGSTFDLLIVGGGGGGANGGCGNGNSGGGGRGGTYTISLTNTTYPITVGNGGSGGDVCNAGAGSASTAFGYTGAGGPGATSGATQYGGLGLNSNWDGTTQWYGYNPGPRAYTAIGYGSGGGGGALSGNWGYGGSGGIVRVRYRIA